MRTTMFVLKLLALGVLCYLLFFLLTGYTTAPGRTSPPVFIFVIDTINLFIHEAGHLFLKPFGMFLHILGGSLIQCLLPLALLITAWRQDPAHAVWPAFWLGQNLVNVSVYIQDAPYRKLRLIAKGLIHDWGWLLAGKVEYAAPLSQAVYWTGILICAGSIVAGLYWAVAAYRESLAPPMPVPVFQRRAAR